MNARLNHAPISHNQSQRDCVLQPRVARNELPWVKVRQKVTTLKGLRQGRFDEETLTLNPFRVDTRFGTFTQGSSFLATLGFEPESLWDSACVQSKLAGQGLLLG